MPADNAAAMEVKKDGLRQCQDGTWKLSLTVHPNDMPAELMTAGMGTRYMAALVEIGDNGQPVKGKEKRKSAYWDKTEGGKAAARAGMLCGDIEFHQYLTKLDCSAPFEGQDGVEWAAENLRAICGVISRKELAHNPSALKKFLQLEAAYKEATGRQAEVRG